MKKTFCIDCFPESAFRYKDDHVIIAVDVMRAMTTAVTAVHAGIRVIPSATLDDALGLAQLLPGSLLVGEVAGVKPPEFDLTNSPVQILEQEEAASIILLSSSGTKLLVNSAGAPAVYLSCFRDFRAVADFVADHHDRIAIIGAGSRNQFRREDKLCCAYLAKALIKRGFSPANGLTEELVNSYGHLPPSTAASGRSAQYLLKSGQIEDLEFILNHYDDLNIVTAFIDGEIMAMSGQVQGTHDTSLLLKPACQDVKCGNP
jgi:2-phosphosulfolactate phosphatase